MSYAFKRAYSPVDPQSLRRSSRMPVIVFRRRGMGDALLDAQNALTAAGYSGASCRTERVSLPMADPTTGRNYYDQNVCSAAGHTGGFMADVINRGGIDLAAERQYAVRQGGGDDTSYFDGIGRGSTAIRYADGVGLPVLNAYDPLPPSRVPANRAPEIAARAVSVSIENSSRPGVALQVGDSWTLRLSGSPNAAVKGSARQDGRDMGETAYGSTDAQGVLTIRGVMKDEHVGSWVQRWTINGMSDSLAFTVQPRAVRQYDGDVGTVGCAQVAKQCPDGSVVGYDPSKPGCVYRPCPDVKGGGGNAFDFDLSSLSMSSPLVWVAAAGAAFLVFGGGGRR